jgi:hypothetical protein
MESKNAVIVVNGKEITLVENGITGGGRKRYAAQFYVPDIGTAFLTAYSQPIGAIPSPIPTPPELNPIHSQPTQSVGQMVEGREPKATKNEVNAMTLEALKILSDKVNYLTERLNGKKVRRYAPRTAKK